MSNFQVEGDKATWTAKVWTDEWRALGVAPLDATAEGVVQDGLLKYWTFTKTPESVAREEAAKAAAAALPVTGGVLFPTHALAMALGGLAVFGGLGLEVLRRRSHPQ